MPLSTAEAIFKKAGLKTRTVPWRGSTVLEGMLDDCERGFSLIIRFDNGTSDGTVFVPGPDGAIKDFKTNECIAAVRGSPEGDTAVGWPLFRGARGGVSYDAAALEIGIDA